MQENKLFPNMSKTEFVIHSSHQRMKRKGNVLDLLTLMESDSFRYLGIMIDKHLSFKNHIKRVVSKSKGVLRRLRISIPMAAAERLCKTMILPIFDY